MNIEWAIEQLADFITASTVTYVQSPPGSFGLHSYKTVASEDEVVKPDLGHVSVIGALAGR